MTDALLRLGFGFVEAGGVTPKPQPAIRVRGCSGWSGTRRSSTASASTATASRRCCAARGARAARGIVGINIGANKDTVDRAADYVNCIAALAPVVSFLTVNVSSPNTPGLRNLQQAAALDDLLARVIDARERAAEGGDAPVLLKIAPDLTPGDLDDVVGVARRPHRRHDRRQHDAGAAPTCASLTATEQGGLSGRPLFPLSTRMLAETYVRAESTFPLIGVGGIDSGAAAFAKIKAGASLVQLYSGADLRGSAWSGQSRRICSTSLRVGRELECAGADAVGRRRRLPSPRSRGRPERRARQRRIAHRLQPPRAPKYIRIAIQSPALPNGRSSHHAAR